MCTSCVWETKLHFLRSVRWMILKKVYFLYGKHIITHSNLSPVDFLPADSCMCLTPRMHNNHFRVDPYKVNPARQIYFLKLQTQTDESVSAVDAEHWERWIFIQRNTWEHFTVQLKSPPKKMQPNNSPPFFLRPKQPLDQFSAKKHKTDPLLPRLCVLCAAPTSEVRNPLKFTLPWKHSFKDASPSKTPHPSPSVCE